MLEKKYQFNIPIIEQLSIGYQNGHSKKYFLIGIAFIQIKYILSNWNEMSMCLSNWNNFPYMLLEAGIVVPFDVAWT